MSAAALMRIPAAVGLSLLAGALLTPSAQAACSAPVPNGASMSVTCPPVGSEQTFVVPPGVKSLRVFARGAPGGSGGGGGVLYGGSGGYGAVASGRLRVTPGSRLYVLVGGIGMA